MNTLRNGFSVHDIGSNDAHGSDFISLAKARTGNLSAVFFSIFASPTTNQGHFRSGRSSAVSMRETREQDWAW
jgi:hypothetical protein